MVELRGATELLDWEVGLAGDILVAWDDFTDGEFSLCWLSRYTIAIQEKCYEIGCCPVQLEQEDAKVKAS